jgi:hypothetical protein
MASWCRAHEQDPTDLTRLSLDGRRDRSELTEKYKLFNLLTLKLSLTEESGK